MRLKQRILKYFEENPGKFRGLNDLRRDLRLNKKEMSISRAVIRDLVSKGRIKRDPSGKYGIEGQESRTGVISVSPRGFGFVRTGDTELYVPPMKLGGAYNGDTVEIVGEYFRGRPEGRVVRVLSRGFSRITGIAFRGYMVPLDDNLPDNVTLVYPEDCGDIPEDRVVTASIVSYDPLTCRLEKVIGDPDDPAVDDDIVFEMFGLDRPEKELTARELRELKEKETAEFAVREDYSDIITLTIDPPGARDHDDAVSVIRSGDGWELMVHIADVSFYVAEGSDIDKEAFARGFSVYGTDRFRPMLTDTLTAEICSLSPGGKRLALTVAMKVDRDGNVTGPAVSRSVISPDAYFTYEEFQDILDGGRSDLGDTPAQMAACAEALHAERMRRNALDLDVTENRVILNDAKEPVDIVPVKRTASHRIIEEFMIAANESVSRTIENRGDVSIFRIHENPGLQSLEALKDTLVLLGENIKRVDASDLNAILKRTQDKPYSSYLKIELLKSLKQAKYSIKNRGHFGLQSSSYTHFTSPIRRYPDLIIHRILKGRAYEGGELSSMASILSESERNAAAAEARSYEIKALRWLGERPDAVYDGIVIRIDLNSVSVELIDYKVRGRAYFKKIGVNIRSLFPGALVKAKVLFTEPLFGYAEMEITDERNNV